jgi:hypothetical protein
MSPIDYSGMNDRSHSNSTKFSKNLRSRSVEDRPKRGECGDYKVL